MLFRLVSCVASANLFRPVSRWLCFVSPPILHPPLCFGCRRHCTIGPSNLWNRAKMPPNMNFGGRSSRKRYYAVYRGKDGFQGVLSDWNSCKSKVHAVPGAVYKSFKTRAEAALFAATGVSSPARVVEKSTQEDPAQRLSAASKSGQDEAIKDVVRCNDEFTEVGFVSESTLTNPDIKAVDGRNLVVFTDGACTRNGRHGACAGVGVYFPPPFSNLSISERLRGAEQTNQRAEQTAVLLAIRTCLNNHLIARGDCLTIKTDSKVCSSSSQNVSFHHQAVHQARLGDIRQDFAFFPRTGDD